MVSTMWTPNRNGADVYSGEESVPIFLFSFSTEGNLTLRHYGSLLTNLSVCLARGRIPIVPCTSLVESCDTWHVSDIADIWDSSVTSIAVMRRDLVQFPAIIIHSR